jgi:hypothetical protein
MGLHSFTFQLNVSVSFVIGGVFRDCLEGVEGVFRGIGGCYGVSVVA